MALDGKTKGGFGGGPWELGDKSGVCKGSSRPMECPAIGSERWRGL